MGFSCKYNFSTPLDMSLSTFINLNLSNIVTSNITSAYFYTFINNGPYAQQLLINTGIVSVDLSQFTILELSSVSEIKFNIAIVRNPSFPTFSADIQFDSLTTITPSGNLQVSVINPFGCNNGIIKVTSTNSTPPYTLICPDGQQIVNNNGVFYVVKGGTYTLTSGSSNEEVTIIIPNNNLRC